MKPYNPQEIEAKWQKNWLQNHTFSAQDNHDLEKFYALIEFPYPSGEGLHVGHPRPPRTTPFNTTYTPPW